MRLNYYDYALSSIGKKRYNPSMNVSPNPNKVGEKISVMGQPLYNQGCMLGVMHVTIDSTAVALMEAMCVTCTGCNFFYNYYGGYNMCKGIYR